MRSTAMLVTILATGTALVTAKSALAVTYGCEVSRLDFIDQIDHTTLLETPIAKSIVETADHAISQITVRDQPTSKTMFLCHGNLCSAADDKLACAFFDFSNMSKADEAGAIAAYLASQCPSSRAGSMVRPVPGAAMAHASEFHFQAMADARAAYGLHCLRQD